MLLLEDDSSFLHVCAKGALSAADYARFVPQFEKRLAAQPAPALMLLELAADFGWTPGGLWQDLAFDFRNRASFARVAVIGHRKWHKWITNASKLLFRGEVRFFKAAERRLAEQWLLRSAAVDRSGA